MKEFYIKWYVRQTFLETGTIGTYPEEILNHLKKYAKDNNMKLNDYINYLLHGIGIDGISPTDILTLKCWQVSGKYEIKSKNILAKAGIQKEDIIGDGKKLNTYNCFNRHYKEVKTMINYLIATDATAAQAGDKDINLVDLLLGVKLGDNSDTFKEMFTKEFKKVVRDELLGLNIEKSETTYIRMGTLYTPNKLKKDDLVDLCLNYIGSKSIYINPSVLSLLEDITDISSLQSYMVSGDSTAEEIWQILLELGLTIKMQLEHYDSDLQIKNVKDLLRVSGFNFCKLSDEFKDIIYVNNDKSEFTLINQNATNSDCVIIVNRQDIGYVVNKDIEFKTTEILKRNVYTYTPNVAFIDGKELSKILSVKCSNGSEVNNYTM